MPDRRIEPPQDRRSAAAQQTGANRLRLHLNGADDLEATVRNLAAREKQCCSFFTFTITRAVDVVTLYIDVPPAHAAILAALAARAATARGRL
jgi:hypothetical protein